MRTQRLRTKRLQFMLTREEVNLLDDFRFQWRIPSRAAAVRELLSRGLATDRSPNGGKSINFGVGGKTPRRRR
jgi:hypothetical protein